MTDSLNTRRPVVRVVVLLMLIGLGLRFIQVAAGEPPPAQAAQSTTGARELLRVEWLGPCGAAAGLGLYRASDAPCQPARQASLAWLQGQLSALGLLAAGEYLEPAPADSRCGAEIRSAAGAPAGRLCADAAGLYRAGLNAGEPGQRWQMWTDGEWVEVQP
jgi:hypothetical protein